MNLHEFNDKTNNSRLPLIIDFWAPWCGPCKAMEPALMENAKRYAGIIELLKINVDESPEVARSLGIMGIPTTLAYVQNKQVFRKTGMLNNTTLDTLFNELAAGKTEITKTIPVFDRFLRLSAGTALLVWGVLSGSSVLLILLGGMVAFSAIYDRCPIYRAISEKVKSLYSKIRNPA